MTTLAPLRSRLNALRLARAAIRWGCALSHLLLVAIAACVAAYLLDRGFDLPRLSRGVVLAASVLAVGWCIARRVAPQVLDTESLEDVALQVEHRQRIDSDLIAALQFDAVTAGAWGSPRLSAAVVEYVADFSPSLNVFEGFSWRPLPSRLVAAATVLLATVAACAAYPPEAIAFWNRFWLGSDHYPTRTVIVKLVINGESISVFHTQPIRLRLAQGQPLKLEAECTGELPAEGEVQVRGIRSRSSAAWKLKATSPAAFQLDPQAQVEDVRVRVKLGDAVSDPIDIAVVPLPIVELHWTVTPPSYAPAADDLAIPDGARQFAVLAGSRLSLRMECVNKQLKSAQLVLPEQSTPLVETTTAGRSVWSSPSGTVLDQVAEPITYEIAAVDADGLSPEPRAFGQIRLRPDRPPRVAAAAISKKALPTAKPRISYGAVDDFGVSRVLMTIDITPETGEPRRDERVVWSKPASQRGEPSIRGEAVLDLSPYALAKGDKVQVTLAAEDDRGGAPPQRGQSEPLTLEVTDRSGILAGLLETDQQSAKQLDAIILRELGLGGGKK